MDFAPEAWAEPLGWSHAGGSKAAEHRRTPRRWRALAHHWERGTSTSYGYNNAGDLTSINYSDPTPDVTFASDRRDRRLTAAQNGANTATFGYNSQIQVTSETWSVGSLNGLALTLSYDRFLRRTNLNVNTGTAIQNAFAYDNASERFVGSEGDRRKGHG